MSSSKAWNPYGGLSSDDDESTSAQAERKQGEMPRPYTAEEDLMIMVEFRAGKSCRKIAKVLFSRTRMSINKRLKKLLRIAKAKEKSRARAEKQSAPGAAAALEAPFKSPRIPRPKGSKSRWYAEDDEFLQKGGSVEELAAKYGCAVVLVEKRKKALEGKVREEAVNARRMAKN